MKVIVDLNFTYSHKFYISNAPIHQIGAMPPIDEDNAVSKRVSRLPTRYEGADLAMSKSRKPAARSNSKSTAASRANSRSVNGGRSLSSTTAAARNAGLS